MTNRLNGRVTRLEAHDTKPQGIQAWAQVIVPLGLTPEEGDALVAAERDKLPVGTGIIVVRIV